ncbi:MAG: hypothetical protein JWO94_213, partial [Verrucomicrobiaceae bacterium]|nr:hypothetical protein [Verrucomicrobiaceae bacterium]
RLQRRCCLTRSRLNLRNGWASSVTKNKDIAMQVSWIDPDEVRDLLKQLAGPQRPAPASAWELHTLPAAPMAQPAHEPLMPDAALPLATVEEPLDPPMAEARTGPANAELWRIRERLRVLRDKAQTAGIFSRPRPDEAPPAVPETTPPPPVAEEEQAPAMPEPPSPAEPAEAALEEMPVSPPDSPAEPEGDEEAADNTPSTAAQPAPPAIESPFGLAEPPPPVYEPLFSTAPPVPPVAFSEPVAEAVAEAPPEAAPAARQNKPPFTVSNQGLSERLNAVAEWVCARLGTREVLLVDDYGDVLWGAQGQTALVLSAMMAWHSAQRASASATCIDPERIDRPLPPDRFLTVLPLRTRFGVVSLAVIDQAPVGEEDATAIRRALALAVEGTVRSSANEGA